MQDYIIMTDSCCDLTDQMARELELEVLPLTMTMDGKEYPNTLDGRYITNEEFYKRLRAGKTSTTAAANVGQFEDAMRAVLGRGQDILCLCFSSALSTTYQSAVIAAENLAPDFPERAIRVIDTLSASRGQGLLVYLAAQKKKEGLTLSQLGDWVEDNKLHVCHWFTVDDLNFLKRGGRVSAATALVGTMLSIKPVMHTDNEGRLTMVGKARGRKASLKACWMPSSGWPSSRRSRPCSSATPTARRRPSRWRRRSSAASAPRISASTTSGRSSAATPAPTPWACSLWERSGKA